MFAITLQCHSTRAYKYIRKSFVNLLPHPRTLSRWYEVVNGEPGFTKEAFEAIRSAAEQHTTIINIVIDAMLISEHVDWDGKIYNGLVNIGNVNMDNNDCNIPKAKNALVFLPVQTDDGKYH